MTPVASWTPADYHAAFNRCRAAWEATSPQLTIEGWADMMDELDAGELTNVEPAAAAATHLEHAAFQSPASSSLNGLDRTPNECRRRPVEPVADPAPPQVAGSQTAGEPHRTPPSGRSTRGQDAPSPALSTTTPRPAEPSLGLRGSGQKGA